MLGPLLDPSPSCLLLYLPVLWARLTVFGPKGPVPPTISLWLAFPGCPASASCGVILPAVKALPLLPLVQLILFGSSHHSIVSSSTSVTSPHQSLWSFLHDLLLSQVPLLGLLPRSVPVGKTYTM